MTADEDIFNGFVFEGAHHDKGRVEQAARAVQPQLSSEDLHLVNDALLSRLAEAKQASRNAAKKELLNDPVISALVNTLALVNQAWIATVIGQKARGRAHLSGASVKELFSTALTGEGTVGGVMNAILSFDYARNGVDAFTPYLTRTITNALLPTPKQKKTYRQIGSRTQSLHDGGEDEREVNWEDRTAPRPQTLASRRELLAVVQSAIDGIKSEQQRNTAAWMIERILATGELPMDRETAEIQNPPVSRERGRQILEATINSLCRQIESDCPNLAEQGINTWQEFKRAFGRTRGAVRIATSDQPAR